MGLCVTTLASRPLAASRRKGSGTKRKGHYLQACLRHTWLREFVFERENGNQSAFEKAGSNYARRRRGMPSPAAF
jgi:hypothetical protein